MKIKLFLFCGLIALSLPARAETPNGLGLGIILGAPSGLSLKYMIDKIHAIDAAIGFNSDFSVHTDFLWHGWRAFFQPKKGKLAAFIGLGARFEDEEKDNEFGIRGVLGMDYWFQKQPLELFIELVPVLQVSPNTEGDFEGGIGLRYYFTKFN